MRIVTDDDMHARPLRFSTVTDYKNTRATRVECSPGEWFDYLDRTHGAGKEGVAFCNGWFENDRRKKSNLLFADFVSLDIDDATGELRDIIAPLVTQRGLSAFVYTSHSHGRPDKWEPGQPRFRVIMPLARSVDADEYGVIWRWLQQALGGVADEAAKDASRLSYLPRERAHDAVCEPVRLRFDSGVMLDPDDLDGESVAHIVRQVEELKARQAEDRQIHREAAARRRRLEGDDEGAQERIEDALSYVDADDRDAWLRCAMALKWGEAAGEVDDALNVWLDWSRTSPKFDERSAYVTWDSIDAGGGITLGTLFALAKQEGWTSPTRDTFKATRETHAEEFISLDEGEARLRAVDAYEPARLVVRGTQGLGKTTSWIMPKLKQYTDDDKAVVLVLPTHDNLDALELRLREKGIKPRRALTRTFDNCKEIGRYSRAHRTIPKGGTTFCKACPRNTNNGGGCKTPNMLGTKLEKGAVTLATHAWIAEHDLEGVDVLIIDESPAETILDTIQVSAEDLGAFIARRWLSGADELIAAMTRCGGDDLDETRLAELCENISVPGLQRTLDGKWELSEGCRSDIDAGWYANATRDDGSPTPIPDWRALQLLADKLKGCELRAPKSFGGDDDQTVSLPGALFGTIHRPLNLDGVEVVRVLDGDIDETTAQAVVPDCEYLNISVELDAGVTITHVEMRATKGDAIGGITEGVRRRLEAVAMRFDRDDDALWIASKAYRTAVGPIQRADRQQRAIHFNGEDARSSNAYETRERAIVLEYVVSGYAMKAHANLIQRITGADELTAYASAQHVKEVAPILQAIHRVRPVRSAVEIVVCARAVPPGMTADQTINAAQLVFEETGYVERGYRFEATKWVLNQVPFITPSDGEKGWAALTTFAPYINNECGNYRPPERASVYAAMRQNAIATTLVAYTNSRALGSGVRVTRIRTSNRGSDTPIIHTDDLTLDVLRTHLDVDWFEWNGERHGRAIDADRQRIDELVADLPAAPTVTLTAIALETSRKSLRRMIQRIAGDDVDVAAWLVARWSQITAERVRRSRAGRFTPIPVNPSAREIHESWSRRRMTPRREEICHHHKRWRWSQLAGGDMPDDLPTPAFRPDSDEARQVAERAQSFAVAAA